MDNDKIIKEQFSNIDLLIILGNESLFEQDTITAANLEWKKRNLEDYEIEALIKQIKDITEEGRNVVSRHKNNNMAAFLKTKGINGEVAYAYAPQIKGSSVMTIVGTIFTILVVIRLLFKLFRN